MKISLNELKELNACDSGVRRFIQQTNAKGDEKYDVAALVGGVNTYSDLLWLAGKKINKSRIVRFACDCALINIRLIEPYCSESDCKLITQLLTYSTYDAAAYPAAAAAAAYAAAADAADTAAAYAADAAATAAYATTAYAADAYTAAAAAAATYAEDAATAKVSNLLTEMFNEAE